MTYVLNPYFTTTERLEFLDIVSSMGFPSPVLNTQQQLGHFKGQEVVPLINSHMDFLLMLHNVYGQLLSCWNCGWVEKPSQVWQPTEVLAK